jgi:hypothetical protein
MNMPREYIDRLVCFDFDGVFHVGERELQEPLPGMLECLLRLHDMGYHIGILSARNPRTIDQWLCHYDFPIIKIYQIKPPALCYVDDRAITFNGNYNDLVTDITRFRPWWHR